MRKLFLTLALVVGTVGLLAIWAFVPSDVSSARQLISSLKRGDGDGVPDWPHLGPVASWRIHIDTYTHDVSSSTIADLYSRACRKLVVLYKDEVKTYSWNDNEGYPRIATIVQFDIAGKPSDVLIVEGDQNNDNDSFTFEYRDGAFDTSKKKLLPSWELPPDHLRGIQNELIPTIREELLRRFGSGPQP